MSDNNQPRDTCTSCGVQFVEHKGIIGTCAQLQELSAESTSIAQRDAKTIADLRWRVADMKRVLEMIRDNYDCDEDSHRYGNPCRCCIAKDVLESGNKPPR